MHLSDMEKMDDMLPVLCEMVEPMMAISCDTEVAKIVNDVLKKVKDAKTVLEQTVSFLPLQCVLLKRFRKETIQIIALTTGKTKEEIEQQEPAQTLGDVRRMITGDFLCFFK